MPLDFPSQIVKPPQVLSHLLCSGRYSAFSHFASFSCCVSRCVSPLCLPGAAIATAHRPDRSEQWSCGGEQFQAPPRWDITGAIDFPAQIVKSPHLSHLLLMVAIFPFPCAIGFPKSNRQISTSPISSAFSGRYSAFSHFTSFSCCVSRCVCPLCLPGAAIATAHRPHRSEQWSCGGERFQAPPRRGTMERHNGCHCISQVKSSNLQKSYLICFWWSLFFPCRTHVPLDFPSQIVKPPQVLSHLLCSGRYSAFLILHHFPVVSSRCVCPLCLPGDAFATAHRPDRSEQWSCGGEQFQAPPWWDTTGAIPWESMSAYRSKVAM